MTELLEPQEILTLHHELVGSIMKIASEPKFTPITKLERPVAKKATMDKVSALADELELLGGCTAGQAEALRKHAVSEEQARQSLDRLNTLERNKPTMGQAARYGGLGAVGGGLIGAVGNSIEHGGPLKGGTPKAKALNLAASVAKGAIGGGAIPLMRTSLDRHAEKGTLTKYLTEQGAANA